MYQCMYVLYTCPFRDVMSWDDFVFLVISKVGSKKQFVSKYIPCIYVGIYLPLMILAVMNSDL